MNVRTGMQSWFKKDNKGITKNPTDKKLISNNYSVLNSPNNNLKQKSSNTTYTTYSS